MDKNEELNALFSNSAIGIITVNDKGEIEHINQFALRQFGYEEAELLGKKIECLVPRRYEKKHVKHRADFQEYSSHSRPMGSGMDLYAVKKDGSEFPVEVCLSSYKTGGRTNAIAFISDITIRKQSEEALKQLNADLEEKVRERTLSLTDTVRELGVQIKEAEEKDIQLREALEKEKELNELKSRFVSMASHEFRTPLSTILSSAYLVLKYQNTEDQAKRDRHVERIVSSVNMLTEILNDFLSLGKIDEGKIQVRFSEFNLTEMINSFINEMNPIVKKGQKIVYDHEGSEIVNLDASLLKHIVMNLVSNAIKFSPESTAIHIKTAKTDDIMSLSVRDSGIGISAEDQEHLFERFYRGANVTNVQGTGLGLHIVGKYAELMNGTIEFNSELEKGTEFTIIFKSENSL